MQLNKENLFQKIENPDEVVEYINKLNEIKGVSYKGCSKAIYCFYSKDNEILYIGKTIDVQNRLRQHWSGKTNTQYCFYEFDKAYIYYIDRETDLDELETILINTLKPKYNKDKAFYRFNLIYDKEKSENDKMKYQNTVLNKKIKFQKLMSFGLALGLFISLFL